MATEKYRPEGSAWPSTVGTLAYILSGPLVWALHLTVIYGGHTLACNQEGAGGTTAWLVIAATVTSLCILLPVAFSQRIASLFGVVEKTTDRPEYQALARSLAGLSAIAVIWSGAAVAFVTACTQVR